jgi:DNA transformation protein and related proteins
MSPRSSRDRALELAGQLSVIGPIEITRFFGGAGLACEGIQFAFVMKGTLYLRVDDHTRPAFEALDAAPFAYAGRVGIVTVASYYALPDEIADDPDDLLRWAERAHRAATTARPSRARPRALPASSFID